jgi:hypothetical protein
VEFNSIGKDQRLESSIDKDLCEARVEVKLIVQDANRRLIVVYSCADGSMSRVDVQSGFGVLEAKSS